MKLEEAIDKFNEVVRNNMPDVIEKINEAILEEKNEVYINLTDNQVTVLRRDGFKVSKDSDYVDNWTVSGW